MSGYKENGYWSNRNDFNSYNPDFKMVLRTEGLVKKYGERIVANNVSINVKQGEIVGLLGPNGAGKTTTFYMTTGQVVPNAGKIFLNDENITKNPVYIRARKGIGYLAQEASVFRKMTVEDNIKSILEMTNFSKEYQKEKLESLISEFNLNHVRHNLGDRLSGGERRRTEIARCLAIEPKFIMLDEPFAGVDPLAVQDIQDIVWKLKEKNIGILITDHNVDETLSITDRAYLLFEGRILFEGTSEDLAANPIVREKYLGRDFELKRRKRDDGLEETEDDNLLESQLEDEDTDKKILKLLNEKGELTLRQIKDEIPIIPTKGDILFELGLLMDEDIVYCRDEGDVTYFGCVKKDDSNSEDSEESAENVVLEDE